MSIIVIGSNVLFIIILKIVERCITDPKLIRREELISRIVCWISIIILNIELLLIFFAYIALVS